MLLLPPDIEDPDVRLQRLLEASRGIVLETQTGATVKLSKFTLKQLSRERKLKRRDARKRGRMHYRTRWKKEREGNKTRAQVYNRFKERHGDRWKISRAEWEETLWPYVEGRSLRLGTYTPKGDVTLTGCWIEDNQTGEKLWEGAEEQLRLLGVLL